MNFKPCKFNKKHQRVNVLNDQIAMVFEECEAQVIHV